MKSFKSILSVILLAIVFFGCRTSESSLVKYKALDENFKFKPNQKIVVFAGTNNDVDILLATKFSEQLLSNGRFILISQSEISRKINKYPLNHSIIDFEIAGDPAIHRTEYLSETSMQKIEELSEKMKSDYLLVVWAGSLYTVSNKWGYRSYIPIYTRMYETRTKRIVGFSSDAYIGNATLSITGQPDEEYVEKILLSAVEGTTADIDKYFR